MNKLKHDNEQLYFLIGALTDAIAQLPQATQQYLIEVLYKKYENAGDEHRDTLGNLIEALEMQAQKNARPSE